MIVPMKKTTVICQKSDRDVALDRLADLGVLHTVPVSQPSGGDTDTLAAAVDDTRRAFDILSASGVAPDAPTEPRTAESVVREALATLHDAHEHRHRAAELHTELTRIADFGDFDPATIHALRADGIAVKLVRYPHRQPPEFPQDAQVRVLSEQGNERTAVVIAMHEFEIGHEVPLPARSVAELRADMEAAHRQADEAHARIARLASYRTVVHEHLATLQDRLAAARVAAGMGDAADLVYLQGFCPGDAIDGLRTAAAQSGWALLIEAPGDDDAVPTLIRNPAWIKPIKAVFDMIGLTPGYREIDISATFLLFFSVFFAMLVGDAGYGALFLLLTLAARRKWRRAPAYPFVLLAILSVCTIVWGVLTGTYFGTFPDQLPAPLRNLTLDWLTQPASAEGNLMTLCFFIGATHLTIAHAWNTIRIVNSTKALAQIGWIALTWTMFFTARTMILGAAFPTLVWGMLWGGLALVALFMTKPREFKTEWPGHVMLPLNVISNFVDVVSYVRLFAVGSASLAVAAAFNDMALAGGIGSIGAGIGAALILFFGHALNIVLGAMGILVHGVRLNTLEFSGHIGMQWSGIPYLPFARRKDGQTGTRT